MRTRLLDRLRATGQCVRVQMPDAGRVALLAEEYAGPVADADACCRALEPLVALRGRAVVEGWQKLARGGRNAELIGALMAEHYDPLDERSMGHSFASLASAPVLDVRHGTPESLDEAAKRLLVSCPGNTCHCDGPQRGLAQGAEPARYRAVSGRLCNAAIAPFRPAPKGFDQIAPTRRTRDHRDLVESQWHVFPGQDTRSPSSCRHEDPA